MNGVIAAPAAHRWITRRWSTASGGIVAELAPGLEPVEIYRRLAGLPGVIFLDSVPGSGSPSGRPGEPPLAAHAFVAADPLLVIRREPPQPPAAAATLLGELASVLAAAATPTIPGLPPFQGGLAGLLSYDFAMGLVGLEAATSGPPTPTVSMGLYDVVFAFDLEAGRGWLISQGFAPPGSAGGGPRARLGRSQARLEAMLARLEAAVPSPAGACGPPAVRSSHTPESYRQMVAEAVELIRAGDIFQVNLAQRFTTPLAADPATLHLAARRINPAPFAAVLDLGPGPGGPRWIVSSSPERLLHVSRGPRPIARMHPIKGTRRILKRPEADLFASADLDASDKDRAENVMIVDLVRNDLSRVCDAQGVRVEAICRLERYAYVQHLVSVVSGRLRRGQTAIDALAAVLPGGSITGAPKRRACEIIAALEGTARGPYCGSIGYLGGDGSGDFNILIRSFVAAAGCLSFSAGGGITIGSDPAEEYAETLHKAEGMLRVLEAIGGETAP